MTAVMKLPALRVFQHGRELYCFAIDGKDLEKITTVSRISRDEEATLNGYQRPEVASHIRSIQEYIESDEAIVPNALVVAFDSRVRFEPTGDGTGELIVPLDPDAPRFDRPGWIVDGQQRSAALRTARVESFPVFVVCFVTDDEAEQRAQFILVNSTKPLPRSLIYELLPATDAQLPPRLAFRRFPAQLLERLNFEEDSPLRGMVSTPTVPEGVIKDNSILRMLENSLSNGALYLLRDPESGAGDIDSMLDLLKGFWGAVARVFPDAWGMPPAKSRLMHGAGVVSMGFVFDEVADWLYMHEGVDSPSSTQFEAELLEIEDVCRWTSGEWEFPGGERRPWNQVQNVQREFDRLADLLVRTYRHRKRVFRHPSVVLDR